MGLELEAGELGSWGAGTRIGHVFYILKSVQVSYLFIYLFDVVALLGGGAQRSEVAVGKVGGRCR